MSSLLHYIRHKLSDEDKKIILDRINYNLRIQPRTTINQYSYTEPQYTQTYNSDYELQSLSGPEFSIHNFN